MTLSALLIFLGIRKKKKIVLLPGILLGAATILFFSFMTFWSEKLWFDSLGFQDRFWTEISTRVLTFVIGAVLSSLVVFLFTLTFNKINAFIRWTFVLFAALFGGLRWTGNWRSILIFLNQQSSGIVEPALSLDAGFYMFVLPFLDFLSGYLLTLGLLMLAAGTLSQFPSGKRLLTQSPGRFFKNKTKPVEEISEDAGGSAFTLSLIFVFIVAGAGYFLSRFHLLFSRRGIIDGPGWTDIHIRMPVLTITAIVTVLLALSLMIPGLRKLYAGFFKKTPLSGQSFLLLSGMGLSAVILTLWILLLGIIPWGAQTFLVKPNEITYERPYIQHNIKHTLQGYQLSEITEQEYAVDNTLTRENIQNNPGIINNIRLWDWRALKSVYAQFQEIRLYYKFNDIDIDRYALEDGYRSVMIAAREMDTENLPANSQTFVNKRFKYTHGYGVAMNTVNEFTESGLPHLLIKDIPPQNTYPSLKIDRPEIYYGESTDSYVVANSTEQEFNYPAGDSNSYSSYEGKGGVLLSSFFRKLMYGWRFKSTQFLFSGYQTEESRVMLNRNIHNRVREAAPFLKYDRDPYIVLSEGKLYWIYDAYTTSARFPYSNHYSGETFSSNQSVYTEDPTREFYNINYIRNSVKVIVDPYNGNMDFYIYDQEDPVINVWKSIYPGLFKPGDSMPQGLRNHVRYPSDYLLVQGTVYAKYHMQDPEVFYNQEDLWVRATEKYYNNVRPVEPYYVMWQRPGGGSPEFVNMLPYTPKNRQVMISWIAGMSDPENYGEFIAYKFPKDKRILGTQQVETKIDQDSFLSGQLTLWDQRGSNVIRGNVLVIPLDGTILYIEPIYLQSETAAYPELRLVAVMHNDNLSYAETFEEALSGLFDQPTGGKPQQRTTLGVNGTASEITGEAAQLADRARRAFDGYLQAQGNRNFTEAAAKLQELQDSLQALNEIHSETGQ